MLKRALHGSNILLWTKPVGTTKEQGGQAWRRVYEGYTDDGMYADAFARGPNRFTTKEIVPRGEFWSKFFDNAPEAGYTDPIPPGEAVHQGMLYRGFYKVKRPVTIRWRHNATRRATCNNGRRHRKVQMTFQRAQGSLRHYHTRRAVPDSLRQLNFTQGFTSVANAVAFAKQNGYEYTIEPSGVRSVATLYRASQNAKPNPAGRKFWVKAAGRTGNPTVGSRKFIGADYSHLINDPSEEARAVLDVQGNRGALQIETERSKEWRKEYAFYYAEKAGRAKITSSSSNEQQFTQTI